MEEVPSIDPRPAARDLMPTLAFVMQHSCLNLQEIPSIQSTNTSIAVQDTE